VTRYSARLRQLEHKLVPNDCPLCGGIAIDFVTLAPGETLPPRPPCTACGAARKAFVVVIDRPQPEPIPSEGIGHNGRAETAPKPRVRRRQWYG
jgi:hypothetical protein